jgi:hypothetical protein
MRFGNPMPLAYLEISMAASTLTHDRARKWP